MTVCPRCSKENQAHYKFCLGCGSELPRDAAKAPKAFTEPTPPSGMQVGGGGAPAPAAPKPAPAAPKPAAPAAAPVAAKPAPAPAPVPSEPAPAPAPSAPAAGGDTKSCTQCQASIPPGFKFCGACGAVTPGLEGAASEPAAAAPVAPGAACLVLIRPDGSEGARIALGAGATGVGRATDPMFANDSYLSPQHASFELNGASLLVRDLDSRNGVYLRIPAEDPQLLENGSIFRIGQEIIRFEDIPEEEAGADGAEKVGSPNPGFTGRLVVLTGQDTTGNAYCIPPDGIYMGRERGDILFPEDGYVSGLHCHINEEGGQVRLTDLGSSNGTFLRIKGEAVLTSGDLCLMGQQLFRIDL